MKKLPLFLLTLLLLIWILAALFFCRECMSGLVAATNAKTSGIEDVQITDKIVEEELNLGTWKIMDGNNFDYQTDDYFRFTHSKFQHLSLGTKGNQNIIANISQYLQGHQNRMLNIVGYYKTDEENSSIFPNLGIARANNIKKMLMNAGVNSNQLTTEGKLLTQNWMLRDTLFKGIDFNFAAFVQSDDRLNSIKSRLVGKPLILYFGTNQNTLNLSAQQRQDFADMIYYLDNVKTAKITVEGHTDNQGQHAYNLNLSRERADFVLDYLSRNGGIAKNRMLPNGFGPDKPLANNDSPEGMAKNRRVEVTLK